MEIVTKKLTDLIPYEKNPRKNDEAVKYVANSIRDFGFKVPIVIDKNNVIVAGHTRYKASQELGLEEVPCIVADDLNEEQINAFRLADNKSGEIAEWDIDLLLGEMENIINLDMTDYGFESLVEDTDPDEVIEDVVPDVPEEPKARYGDIYKLGNHRLMCGDSTNPDDVAKLMGGEIVDMVFTDPPYGVSYQGNVSPDAKEWEMIANDDLRGDKLFQFLLEAFKNIKTYLKQGGAFYIWYANGNTLEFENALLGAGLKKKQIIIWQKGMVLGHSDYHWTYEPCLYGCHPEQNSTWYGDRTQKTLWDLSKKEIKDMKKDEMQDILERLWNDKDIWEISRDNTQEYVHPTQKPVGLSAKALHNSTQRGDNVLDLFGGSGSTLMGCEQLERKAFVMEYDPKYVDVIIERWENFTGQKAELIQKGK